MALAINNLTKPSPELSLLRLEDRLIDAVCQIRCGSIEDFAAFPVSPSEAEKVVIAKVRTDLGVSDAEYQGWQTEHDRLYPPRTSQTT